MKKLFVFTGGGLAPALNPTIYGVVSAARENGWEVYGGLFGWASLLRNGRHISFNDINIDVIRDIGGTLLRSSRTNPRAIPDGLSQIKEKLKELEIDAVVAIGGEDTLGSAAELFKEGVPIVGVPKTIDNDLSGTYFTPGFPSAAHYLSSLTNEIKEDAAYALSRIFVIESMGMKAGWLTASSVYGHPDVIIPPEKTVSLKRVLELTNKRYIENGNFATVVVAQEAKFDEPLEAIPEKQLNDQYGHARNSFICLALKDRIKKELGIDTKAVYPGNFLETGRPIELDRDIAINLGRKAFAMVMAGEFGKMAAVVRPNPLEKHLTVETVTLSEAAGKENYRAMPDDFFDYNNLQPTKKFTDYMEPLLGPYQPKDHEYAKLVKMITSRQS